MTEIKPCPFCGSGDIRINKTPVGAWLQCERCFAEINLHRTEKEAIEAWNRRIGHDNRQDSRLDS